ncbi:MAG TPA: thioredoxin domain-containing protein [Saprospiraceae bacterium]|nr:thioredoxin domain-containing protein [Saprospiraceae bacterium]
MYFRPVVYTLLSLLFMECNTPGNAPLSQHRYTNHLARESSPYLLQHAHNPVNWYPWKEEALAKAKAENKMLVISIGYAACHWCHVMEHESFEDTAVAKIMNDNFVSIKVDREERPDIDDIYMTACHLASGGNCGWPLNAFAMPDGKPVWAGTYFPKKEWIRVLEYFIKLNNTEPEQLQNYADSLSHGIVQSERIELLEGEKNFTEEVMYDIGATFVKSIDPEWGGRKGAPKFPMPNNYHFLMRYAYLTGDAEAKQVTLTTLNKMANGGIYDQIGGGFSRYSVDARWHVPHFEKMLYDNGQLVSLYAQAYQWTKNPLYAKVIRETLEFVQREMTDASGGFYSSLDADSEGEEGKFYVWTAVEIDSLIPEPTERKVIGDYFDIRSAGNWEHNKNVLQILKPLEEVSANNDLSSSQCEKIVADGRACMFSARASRVRPGLDDKILTSWNALMLKGYVDAYRALQHEDYLRIALTNAEFIEKQMWRKDGGLNRNYKDGTSGINAFLDDYALVIEAWIALYQVTFDEAWLDKAHGLAEYVLAHFFDAQSGMFYYTSDLDPPLIARKKELGDNVIPASNSILAKALYTLGLYFYKQEYLDHAAQMLHNMIDQITTSSQPGFYSNWCDLNLYQVKPPYEVAIVGEEADARNREMMQHYLPQALFLGGKSEGSLQLLENKLQPGETFIYVCRNKVCKFPVKTVEEAIQLMR